MISTRLRGLVSSMKAHVDGDTASKRVMQIFAARLHELADDIEQLEAASIPPHLRKPRRSSTKQLELVEGGRQ